MRSTKGQSLQIMDELTKQRGVIRTKLVRQLGISSQKVNFEEKSWAATSSEFCHHR